MVEPTIFLSPAIGLVARIATAVAPGLFNPVRWVFTLHEGDLWHVKRASGPAAENIRFTHDFSAGPAVATLGTPSHFDQLDRLEKGHRYLVDMRGCARGFRIHWKERSGRKQRWTYVELPPYTNRREVRKSEVKKGESPRRGPRQERTS